MLVRFLGFGRCAVSLVAGCLVRVGGFGGFGVLGAGWCGWLVLCLLEFYLIWVLLGL